MHRARRLGSSLGDVRPGPFLPAGNPAIETSEPRVLSCQGAKEAVVWGDNRAPWTQTEDVIRELMHPHGRGFGCQWSIAGGKLLGG